MKEQYQVDYLHLSHSLIWDCMLFVYVYYIMLMCYVYISFSKELFRSVYQRWSHSQAFIWTPIPLMVSKYTMLKMLYLISTNVANSKIQSL